MTTQARDARLLSALRMTCLESAMGILLSGELHWISIPSSRELESGNPPRKELWLRHGCRRFSACNRAVIRAEATRRFLKMKSDDEGSFCTDEKLTVPVTYYQILGLENDATEETLLKAYRMLRFSSVSDAYSHSVVLSRQEVLEDAKNKLAPRLRRKFTSWNKVEGADSFVLLPRAWIPGALSLLQEAGAHEAVAEIGTIALEDSSLSHYHHDIIVAMALSKCSKAQAAFECSEVSEGYEQLVQAHMLLKERKHRLQVTSLLLKIEASLEEMAPACALEHLRLSLDPAKNYLRPNALAGLRELVNKGLRGESSYSSFGWEKFLSDAMLLLTAEEICSLMNWEELFQLRNEADSKEAQRQKSVFGVNCVYTVLVAHIASGFARRQPLQVLRALRMARIFSVSDNLDLHIEEAVCATILGELKEAARSVAEVSVGHLPDGPCLVALKAFMSNGDISRVIEFTESWLSEHVLNFFPDTRGCCPSVADFHKQTVETYAAKKHEEYIGNPEKAGIEKEEILPPRNKQQDAVLVPNKSGWRHLPKLLLAGALTLVASVSVARLLELPKGGYCECHDRSRPWSRVLDNVQAFFPSPAKLSALKNKNRRPMDINEAEVLVRHWQAVKAAALGPQHARHCLSDILTGSMLAQWQKVADDAVRESCHWRFVLLNVTIRRADIVADELGWESAELEAVLEEAAELVSVSFPPKNNSKYYSTYRVVYRLCRSPDRTWRISQGTLRAA